jgi:Na+/H+ antiporter NhaD/arsenite permease-like protein
VLFVYAAAVALHVPLPGGGHAAVETHGPAPAVPPYIMVAPFVLLLGAIAVLPIIPRTHHWWENNLRRFAVAAALGCVTLAYYALARGPASAAGVLQHALLDEYVPFIVLLFSLYTISGGIRISGDLRARPLTNCGFLACGAVLASLIGTTGAAMLLIRPLLETNSERRRVTHTVIFFIFVVCNCGGLLLPIGDPPLFLGYLRGVDFLWTLNLLPQWLFVNGLLIAIYYAWDALLYRHEAPSDLLRDETRLRPLRFTGLALGGPLLAGVVLAAALLDPGKPLPGTHWHPLPYLREVVMLALAGCSLYFGSASARRDNRFTFHAIAEVAALFFGIFLCMQPALEILKVHGPKLGLSTAEHFFWTTGALSSVLDNAPTYLVFFQTAHSLPVSQAMASAATGGVAPHLLVGISLGAVMLGALTYIGNGPNFMIKAIAEKSGVRMPSFFGYALYSSLVLLPVFWLVTRLYL